MHSDPPSFHNQPLDLFARSTRLQKDRHSKTLRAAARFSVAHYSWVILAAAVVFVTLETLEHLSIIHLSNVFFAIEVLMAVFLLGSSALLIQKLLVTVIEAERVNETLQVKNEFGFYLSTAHGIEEVSKRIVQKAGQIVPGARVALYTANEGSTSFELMNALWEDSSQPAANCAGCPAWVDANLCRHCPAFDKSTAVPLSLCRQNFHFSQNQKTNGYCLPLCYGNTTVGLLQFYMDGPVGPVIKEIGLIENAKSEISSALYSAIERRKIEESVLTQRIRDVKLDIARDLHDTVGQNIGYLRMRLNYMVDSGVNTGETAGEIQHMFNVAKESYDLIRGTMAVLQSNGSTDLEQLLSGYARQVAERSKCEIIFNAGGQPESLSTGSMLQLFFIFREALSNIEKHACASQVFINMDWNSDKLSLSISDNGCGFDPQQAYGGHYGLKIMQDRVSRLHGTLNIRSTTGSGSTVHVQIPYQ